MTSSSRTALNRAGPATDTSNVRRLKLALLVELELGVVWTLTVAAARSSDAELAAALLFLPVYGVQLLCMVMGGYFLWKRPDQRALAAAVVSVPVMLLFVPIGWRLFAGGPVGVHPAAWFALAGVPLGACLLAPHHAASFLPQWTFRSRWLNLGTVVLLAAMTLPWIGLLVVAPAQAAANPGGSIRIDAAPEGDMLAMWVGAFFFALLSIAVAGFTLLTSYVGLFQRVDRKQQKLRVTQLVLSLVVLVPSVVVAGIGLVILAIAGFNPG